METKSICRCCLIEGPNKDFDYPYTNKHGKEVYSEMLLECFDIVLSHNKDLKSCICDPCIDQLRRCLLFKNKVLKCEHEFLKISQNWKEEATGVDVKVEKFEEDFAHDSDDLFLADLGSDRTQKKEKSINIGQTRIKVASKLTLARKLRDDREVSHIFKKNDKHASNVKTILKFSNAVPFKNHSVLGYICAYCNNAFSDPSNLRAHVEGDHKKNRLNIDIKRQSPVVNLDITDLTCALCDETMDNLFTFKEHIVKIHKETIHNDIKDQIMPFKLNKGNTHECTMCTSKYKTFKMLKQHMNKHYRNYVCDKCDTGFVTKRSLDTHLTTHIEGNFKCDYCEKVFANKTKKSYHEKLKHLGAKNIKNCVYCEAPFSNYYRRNQHLMKVHNLEAKYKCNVCDKPYLLKSLLMSHIKKNHLMEKNCQCNECGHRFFSKRALKRHMVKHTGEKNFNCTVCNKSYARKYTLTEHMKIHNNDRRFKCSVCELSFVQKCSLKSHLLSNHGISMAASDIVKSTSSQPMSSVDDGE